MKVIVPVGLKPPASVAESVSLAPLPTTTAGPAVVVIVGLAGLTTTGSLPAGAGDRVVVGVAAVAGHPLVGAGHRPVVGSVKPVGVV